MDHPGPEEYDRYPVGEKLYQSPPVDTSAAYDAGWVKGKTILITGGASGFGAGYARTWAANGANIIIGDVNEKGGLELVQQIRTETGNGEIHFVRCDVTDWQSQVDMFKQAVKLSPHGGIDTVVANAGVGLPETFERPPDLAADAPPKPKLTTFEINLVGVLYTAHLAIFWLPKNPGSSKASIATHPAQQPRDRHLLLVGSLASLSPIPGQVQYGVSKHGVLGLFRCLRATSFVRGFRVNLICPYFIDTPILPPVARVVLAGGGMGKPEDVVDAATRLVADTRIIGHSLCIGPRMLVERKGTDGYYQLARAAGRERAEEHAEEHAVWEAYSEDFADSEVFVRNMTRLLNAFASARGWIGWLMDIAHAIVLAFTLRRQASKKKQQ